MVLLHATKMAAVDFVAIPYESNYVTFDDLRLGHSTSQVVGRLLRFWDARKDKEDGEFTGIVCLLLDEKNSIIHGFVSAAAASQFRHQLQEGMIYNIGEFYVAKCTNLHRITDHPFVIRFLPTTTIAILPDATITIRKEKFRIRKLDHLHALANTNIELPDVVGQIRFVQGPNLDDPNSRQRLVVRFRVDTSDIVYLSLWDEVAANFRAHIASGRAIHSVMVVTTINPKLCGGNLYLNSTPATRFFFDSAIHVIDQFTKSLQIEVNAPFTVAETRDGIQKKEKVTICELHKYISQYNEQTQDTDFLCKARVVGVLRSNGWSYIACGRCMRRLDKCGTSLRCNRCVTPDATCVLRYRVELAVKDQTGNATFVVYNSEMTNITKKTAANLTVDEGNSHELPNCLASLAGKLFDFEIKVTPCTFPPRRRFFTVTTITEATIVEDDAKVADQDDSYGGNSSSKTTAPMTEKDSSRKRGRE